MPATAVNKAVYAKRKANGTADKYYKQKKANDTANGTAQKRKEDGTAKDYNAAAYQKLTAAGKANQNQEKRNSQKNGDKETQQK
jgi:hypothetical protein